MKNVNATNVKKALELLGCEGIRENIDFNAFALITDFFVVGSPLTLIGLLPDAQIDNLSAMLDETLNKLPDFEYDNIDISGRTLYPIPLPVDDHIGLLTSIIDALEALDIPVLLPLITLINTIIALGADVLAAVIDILIDLIATLPNFDLASLCNLKAVAFQTLPGTVPGTTTLVTRFQAVRQAFKRLLDKYCQNIIVTLSVKNAVVMKLY